MTGTHPLRNRSTGFSLLEMLLVIAILVVLIALSLPVVNQIITKSQLLQCAGNFRQLGAVLGSYAGDHKGEWPWPIDSRVTDDPGKLGGWIARPLKTTSGEWSGIGKLFPYIRDRRVYVCPANKTKMNQLKRDGNYSSEEGTIPTSYVTRGYNQSYHPTKPKFFTLAALGRRSITACNFAYAASNPVNAPLSWHQGTYPVLFSDGSVEQIRFPEGAVNKDAPPNINDSTAMQMKIWDYFDGKTATLKLN